MYPFKKNEFMKISIFFLLLFAAGGSFARSTDLKDPKPVNIPNGISSEQAQIAVKGALIQKGWRLVKIESESPRVDEVEYRVKNHIMALTLEYSQNTISFKYLRSENLNYKATNNSIKIHPLYNTQAQGLADQISDNLAVGNDFTLNNVSSEQAGNLPPSEAFVNFDQIVFEPVTLGEKVTKNKTTIRTKQNLEHNIQVEATAKVPDWNKPNPTRTLLIKTNIVGLKFVGGGTRFFAGIMAGRSWISVKLTFVEKSSGKIVGNAYLYRMAEMANGFTLARADYAMVENMGRDIVNYINSNYEKATGGGTTPPN